MNLPVFGKLLIGLGVGLAILGLVLWLVGQSGLTHLPGDLVYRRGRFAFYFPIVTSIVLSVVITVILNLLARLR